MIHLRSAYKMQIACIATLCCSLCHAGELRSPWDAVQIAPSDVAYLCPPPPQLPHDFAVESYYIDAHHSIADPAKKAAYESAVSVLANFSRAVVHAADAYQIRGSREAATCAASLLLSAAKQGALSGFMQGHQAVYVQGSQLGAWAVAFLKIRNAGVLSQSDARFVTDWLKQIAEHNVRYYDLKAADPHSADARNNHLYWAGFAVAAAAIAANDDALFHWALRAYKTGIDQIQSDGTLPLELDRASTALHYHLYALAPLIMLAEFGAANGLDLYAENGYAIKRLVARCVAALRDPAFFAQKTRVRQVVTPQIETWQIAWAKPYTARFPDPGISALLEQAKQLSYTDLGGLPPPVR